MMEWGREVGKIKMNNTQYKNRYKKEHYIRKEINFTKEQWEMTENYLKKNETTLKEIIINQTKKD